MMHVNQKDLDTFLEVADALKRVRDGRLYCEKYDSFDAYCRAKVGKPAKLVEELIARAEIEKRFRDVPPDGRN